MGDDDLRDAIEEKLMAWQDWPPPVELINDIINLCKEKFKHDLKEWGPDAL